MRLSFEQARLLNIDEDIIRRAQECVVRQSEAARVQPPKPKPIRPADGYDSKLERDFAEALKRAEREQWIKRWWHHPCGFRLAPKCYYHVDFMVMPKRYSEFDPVQGYSDGDDRLTCVECKGGWFRDDSKVKIKVAAEMFPCFRWLLVFREKRTAWDVREITTQGVGTCPIIVPWIQ